jgi:hypothetical protein
MALCNSDEEKIGKLISEGIKALKKDAPKAKPVIGRSVDYWTRWTQLADELCNYDYDISQFEGWTFSQMTDLLNEEKEKAIIAAQLAEHVAKQMMDSATATTNVQQTTAADEPTKVHISSPAT